MLAVHLVLFYFFDFDGAERIHPHVESYTRDPYSGYFKSLHHLRREMEPSGGSCGRPRLIRKDCLIPLLVLQALLNVRRKRRLAGSEYFISIVR